MPKVPPVSAAASATPLDEAHRLRLSGDVWRARRLARELLTSGDPGSAAGARELLALTGVPRLVFVCAVTAAAILMALVTLASLRS